MNLDKFTGLSKEDFDELAKKIIETGNSKFVIWNLDKFTGLDEKIIKDLTKKE
jgi:hypothetical protein